MFQIGFVFCAVVLRCSQGFKTRSRSALRHSLGVSAVITSLCSSTSTARGKSHPSSHTVNSKPLNAKL